MFFKSLFQIRTNLRIFDFSYLQLEDSLRAFTLRFRIGVCHDTIYKSTPPALTLISVEP